MTPYKIIIKDYLDFLDPDDIRIKGTRVGIETVLDDYLNGVSPEEMAIRYSALTLEQIYATITYYLGHPDETGSYLRRWRKYAEESWQEQQRNPSPAVSRLREIKMQRQQREEAA